ncbi:MAG: PAS domain-containing protein [Acetobacteraceae bacterium]
MKLARDEQSTWLTRAALDALPAGIGIVDAGLRIRFVNDVARSYLAAPDAGLFSMRSGPYAGSGTYLAAMSRDDAAILRRLVASASAGGPGGCMRIASRSGAVLAVMVSPVPNDLMGDGVGTDRPAPAEPLAMVVVEPLDRKVPPAADLLCDLYGLSRAEAEGCRGAFRRRQRRGGGAPARRLAHDRTHADPLHPRQIGMRESARLRAVDGDLDGLGPAWALARALAPINMAGTSSIPASSDDAGIPLNVTSCDDVAP